MEKLSVKYETQEIIDDEVNEDELYNLEKLVSMKNHDVSVSLKTNQKYT